MRNDRISYTLPGGKDYSVAVYQKGQYDWLKDYWYITAVDVGDENSLRRLLGQLAKFDTAKVGGFWRISEFVVIEDDNRWVLAVHTDPSYTTRAAYLAGILAAEGRRWARTKKGRKAIRVARQRKENRQRKYSWTPSGEAWSRE